MMWPIARPATVESLRARKTQRQYQCEPMAYGRRDFSLPDRAEQVGPHEPHEAHDGDLRLRLVQPRRLCLNLTNTHHRSI